MKDIPLLIDQHRKSRQPIPDWIQNAPELMIGLDFYYQAFLDLMSCRQLGMAEGPIPWSAINDYAIRYELEDDEFERFRTIINGMDAEYVKYRSKQDKKTG